MQRKLENNVAVVTGGSAGIGFGAAKAIFLASDDSSYVNGLSYSPMVVSPSTEPTTSTN